MKAFIYVVKNPQDEIRYVGCTKRGEFRFVEHMRQAKAGRKLPVYDMIRKYLSRNQLVQFEIVEYCAVEDLSSRERYWINHFLSQGFRLLNCTEGGEGLQNPSIETRKRISIAKQGSKNHFFGKPARNRKSVKAVNIVTGDEKLFSSCVEAAIFTNNCAQNVGAVARGVIRQSKGWTFSYLLEGTK